LALNGSAGTKEFEEEVAHLRKFAEGMDPGTPARAIIEGLEQVLAEVTKGDEP
jgi:hypothetical protein